MGQQPIFVRPMWLLFHVIALLLPHSENVSTSVDILNRFKNERYANVVQNTA
ncbi:hypothetical protein BABINDRAFT_161008 [Babjeviella inositovora NRRL Y-12698]|uniref:Uncharacterized protein n=1 Tax=Babjeviella inositovora NRRL Y-12698 TaxID=984486 RepID=A0A1E3QT32_9ASCO|nr:uncharacterized protein BABINDRAFT_161008 [Babjeviella inositovora NRRL Y-12698]ODQ80798.1 hypothetical protein BABINDRAFT_161008 [Babjeviella inositovora NRRL Y-12698]